MASTTFSGKSSGRWHAGPTMSAGGTLTGERDGDIIKGQVQNAWSSRASGSYGYPVEIQVWSSSKSDGPIVTHTTPSGGNWSNITFNWSVESSEETSICVVYICGQTGGCSGGSQDVWNGGQNDGHQGEYWCQVYGLTSNQLDFEAGYKTPTVSVSGDKITRHDVDRTVSIGANTSGDKNDTKVYVTVNNNTSDDIGIKNNSGTYTFKPLDKGVGDGLEYTVKVKRVHGKKSSLSAEASTNLLTFRTPIIRQVALSESNFSGIGNTILNWQTNSRRWGYEYEDDFETYYKFGDKDYILTTDQTPLQSSDNKIEAKIQPLTKQDIDNIFTPEERSQDIISTTLTMKRYSPRSKVEATQTINTKIQFRPKYAPEKLIYRNNQTDAIIAPESTTYLDEAPEIRCEWTYPDYADRGVINGYIVRVYEDSNYIKKFSEHIVETEELVASLVLNTREDLKRGQMNCITVSAYYNKPTDKSKMEGPILQQTFIFPIGKLYSPKVPYPVNKSQWHNKNFRILVELPFDDDYDVLDDIIQNKTYRYKDIEVAINDRVFLYSQYPNIFSTETLGYQTKICINPSLIPDFEDTGTYEIKVRVQKNYYLNIWSQYTTTNISIIKIKNLDLKVNDLILATHYKYVQSASKRLWNVYPINTLPENNIDQNINDVIYAKHYQGIYDTILQIQKDVNEWAVYDDNKFNVKFNQTINTMTGETNKPKNDFITAVKDDRPSRQGRNYKNILIDCMNKLY